jgi:hypothetical protein
MYSSMPPQPVITPTYYAVMDRAQDSKCAITQVCYPHCLLPVPQTWVDVPPWPPVSTDHARIVRTKEQRRIDEENVKLARKLQEMYTSRR